MSSQIKKNPLTPNLVMQQLYDIYMSGLSPWAMQKKAAPLLRRIAIEHLASGAGPIAQGFRGAIQHPDMQAAYTSFLQDQAKDGAWGTYIELEALCEYFKVSGMVTTVNAQNQTWVAHRAEDNNAPVIHLCNSNNTHWYVKNSGDTLGNGNCLYNAFATGLQKACFAHTLQQSDVNQASSIDKQAIALQKQLLDEVAKPSVRMENLHSERQRLASLPVAELKQICADHALALQLAREEVHQAAYRAIAIKPMACSYEIKETATQLPRLVN
jgi:hypothetical protein